MSSDQVTELRKVLTENVYNFNSVGGGGSIVRLPNYEIHPREFLSFAEDELEDLGTNKSIVNCISNLKRAIDCQLDIFLYALNLSGTFKKKRLGVDKKLGFAQKAGLLNDRSIAKLNTIRNKLEHEFKLPEIEDVRVYFELISACIALLENGVGIGGFNSELEFEIQEWPEDEDAEPKSVGFLTSRYDAEKPELRVVYRRGESKKDFVATTGNLDELAFFIKAHGALLAINATHHGEYANRQLEEL